MEWEIAEVLCVECSVVVRMRNVDFGETVTLELMFSRWGYGEEWRQSNVFAEWVMRRFWIENSKTTLLDIIIKRKWDWISIKWESNINNWRRGTVKEERRREWKILQLIGVKRGGYERMKKMPRREAFGDNSVERVLPVTQQNTVWLWWYWTIKKLYIINSTFTWRNPKKPLNSLLFKSN